MTHQVYVNRWQGDRPEHEWFECGLCAELRSVVEMDTCDEIIYVCAQCLTEALSALNKAVLEDAAKERT